METLKIGFLWHQHQPSYKDPEQDIFILPWTRFHGLKDYYDLVAILDDFPKIHQNFNLVPSLIVQLDEYVSGKGKDYIQILSEKKPQALSRQEKIDILKYFFQLNLDRLVDPFPRYRELLEKRGRTFDEKNPDRVLRRFSDQDFLDLQVWYNLSWTGEAHKSAPPFRALFEKGEGFTEAEKKALLEAQQKILEKIIPKYIEVAQRGQIELSTTPFYHPILPLLCDTDVAKMSQPDIQLPKHRFRHPEDADAQIGRALEFFQKRTGKRPVGMWPSEGSVSEEVAALFAKNRVKWIATDEEILFSTWNLMGIQHKMAREDLYRPYRFGSPSGEVHIFFRDHTLSDLIGFVYQSWDPEKAAEDFFSRLRQIRTKILQRYGEAVLHRSIVSVILDGENCWEYYPQNGRPFLQALYERLSSSQELQTVTFSEFLGKITTEDEITRLFPGSWINHNFSIWIGHPEDNRAWDLLYQTREFFSQKEREAKTKKNLLEEAREEIYVAEGSDWCWWYGDEHPTENALEFDRLFRSHLIRVYTLLGEEPPVDLLEPIRTLGRKKVAFAEPIGFISPVIDGLETNYFEWLGSGMFDARRQGAAMHQTNQFVEVIHFGFDLQHFYLKVLFSNEIHEELENLAVQIDFFEPRPLKILLPLKEIAGKELAEEVLIKSNGDWQKHRDGIRVAFKKFLEMGVPFSLLGGKVGNRVQFQVKLLRDRNLLEVWPRDATLDFNIPGPDFEQIEWKV